MKPDPTIVEVVGPLGPLVVGRPADPPVTLGPPRVGEFCFSGESEWDVECGGGVVGGEFDLLVGLTQIKTCPGVARIEFKPCCVVKNGLYKYFMSLDQAGFLDSATYLYLNRKRCGPEIQFGKCTTYTSRTNPEKVVFKPAFLGEPKLVHWIRCIPAPPENTKQIRLGVVVSEPTATKFTVQPIEAYKGQYTETFWIAFPPSAHIRTGVLEFAGTET